MVKNRKTYDNNWPIVAICYDFDKTLSPKDMQNFGLIPKLGCKVAAFWRASNKLAKERGMDKILAYMKLIIDNAELQNQTITRADFNELGKTIELFKGVESWFERVNAIASELKINVEHYIISAGIKEIIEGTSIAQYFTEIYASEFYYDQNGKPVWPCQVVNYTSKTQYLFRINKDCLDLSDEESVNDYIPDSSRRIPLKHFIYIGDSETDIPAMKIVKQGGGFSIGVYNPKSCNIEKVTNLLQQERIDFLMPANYTEGSKIEQTVESILKKIRSNHDLSELNKAQKNFVSDLDKVDNFISYTDKYLSDSEISTTESNKTEKQSKRVLKKIKKDLLNEHSNVVGELEIETFMKKKEKQVTSLFAGKRKEIQKSKLKNSKKAKTAKNTTKA